MGMTHDGHHHHHGGEDGDSAGGENLFACFGVAHGTKKDASSSANDNDEQMNTNDQPIVQEKKMIGIIGYDSSLGAHGPLVLAPIRASVMILVWCACWSFLVRTHAELTRWLTNFDNTTNLTPEYLHEQFVAVAVVALQVIQYVMSIVGGGSVRSKRDNATILDLSSTDEYLGLIYSTVIYAVTFIMLLEMSLYILGKVFSILCIYVPKGVSHPGGPRPHKIVRVPQWTEGKQHYLSKELLTGNTSNSKWRCAVAHDAHRDTIAKFNAASSKRFTEDTNHKASQLMSGEPFGRQIWTLSETQPSASGVETEDDLVSTLKKEFASSKHDATTQSKINQQKDEHIFSPLMRVLSPENDQSKSTQNQPDLMELVSGLFGGNNESGQSTKQKQQQHQQNQLIRDLASGGRAPLAFDPSKNPNTCDQIFRAQMIASYLEQNVGKLPEEIAHLQQTEQSAKAPAKTVMESARRGIAFYSLLQTSDGHFAGDYGGPHFLLPGLVVAWYVMGRPAVMISPAQQALMLHYLRVHQQADGGWGTHIESPSTMFGTVVCYLAARLLGAKKDDEWIKEGRDFIQKEGGAVMTSSWAKFWLCLVGCMDWKGMIVLIPLHCIVAVLNYLIYHRIFRSQLRAT